MAVGQREVDEETVALRRLGSKHQKVLALDEAISAMPTVFAKAGRLAHGHARTPGRPTA